MNYTFILSNPRIIPLYDDDEPTPLSFLVHYVGDVHQPLHAGYGCDSGGTKSDVYFLGKHTNLHSVWDSSIIDTYSGGDWIKVVIELQYIIDQNTSINKYSDLINKLNVEENDYEW